MIKQDDLVMQKLDNIENQLKSIQEQANLTFQFFNKALRKNDLKTEKENVDIRKDKIYKLIHTDTDIRYPHQKIIFYLLNLYDYKEKKYRKSYFTQIVKGTSIGKNMANKYLSFLLQKGLIERSTDGYKVFYNIKNQ